MDLCIMEFFLLRVMGRFRGLPPGAASRRELKQYYDARVTLSVTIPSSNGQIDPLRARPGRSSPVISAPATATGRGRRRVLEQVTDIQGASDAKAKQHGRGSSRETEGQAV